MRDNLRRHTVNEPLAALAEKDAEIAKLRAEVERLQGEPPAPDEIEDDGEEADLATYREAYARLYRQWRDAQGMLREQWVTIDSPSSNETDRLRAGITAAVEGNYPMPVGERWRKDGQPSDHDRCVHGAMMNEGCEECLCAHLLALLDPPPAPDGGEERHG